MKLSETNQQIRPLDIAFNLLYYMHTTWPVHEHYFCNETCLSILFNKKIENFVIITSALPEYIEKRFHNLCFERSQDRGLHRFKIIYDGLPVTILSVDEYPWLESYVEKYANFNAELLFMDWESQVKDPYNVSDDVLNKRHLKLLYDNENNDNISQDMLKYIRLFS